MGKPRIGKCQLPKLLAKRGITHQQLSDMVNIAPSQISDYVARRRTMSLITAKLISGALNCHIDDLYEWF